MVEGKNRPRTRALLQATGVGGVLVAVAIAISACGSTPDAGVANLGSSSTTSTTNGPSLNSGTSSGNSGSSQSGSPQAVPGGHTVVGMMGVTVQFSQCMRTHGVPTFPDPNGQGTVQVSGINPQSSAFRAAQKACAKYAPNGGQPPSAAQQAQRLAQALAFSKCMRSHGVSDYPDPQEKNGGIEMKIDGSPGSDLNPNNPTFAAAQTACRSLLPGGGAAFSSGSKAGDEGVAER
jgi:hypothetical protein